MIRTDSSSWLVKHSLPLVAAFGFVFGLQAILRVETEAYRASEAPLPLLRLQGTSEGFGDIDPRGFEKTMGAGRSNPSARPLEGARADAEATGGSDREKPRKPPEGQLIRKPVNRRWDRLPKIDHDKGLPKRSGSRFAFQRSASGDVAALAAGNVAAIEGCDAATVGGHVWEDLNANGLREEGEPPVPGITVKLFVDTNGDRQADALADELTTGDDGTYQFTGVDPCEPNYNVQFIIEGTRWSFTLPNVGDIQSIDSDALDTVGGFTGWFQLDPAEVVSFYDAGLIAPKLDYGTWAATIPGAGNNPLANNDGDLYSDLVEYALCLDPNVGVPHLLTNESVLGGVWMSVDEFNRVLLHYTRPVGGLLDVSTAIEVSADLVNWSTIGSPNSSVDLVAYSVEQVSILNFNRLSGVPVDRGYVRLRFQLGGDTAYTPMHGWANVKIGTGYQTYCHPFLRDEVFAARVTTVNTSLGELRFQEVEDIDFPAYLGSAPYYAEVLTGAAAGQRYEVDVAGSRVNALRVDFASPLSTRETFQGVAGETVVVRPHHTLDSCFPKSRLIGSADPAAADQVSFFNGQGFDGLFLLGARGLLYWTSLSSSDLLDGGGRVVPPGTGVFLQHRGTSLNHFTVGMVRTAPLALPLGKGYNLVGTVWPEALSPAEAAMRLTNGFKGSRDPNAADQIQRWAGDLSTGAEGYDSLFLLDAGVSDFQYWTSATSSDLSNLDNSRLLAPGRAFFIRKIESDAGYLLP